VIDWFDSSMPSKVRLDLVNETGGWHVAAAFNWQDQARDIRITLDDFKLDAGNYLTREFWIGQWGKLSETTPLTFPAVPAHGCVLLALRRLEVDKPIYLGSTFHFSQGAEVAEWASGNEGIKGTLRLMRHTAGEIYFYYPSEVKRVEVNGMPVHYNRVQGNIYSAAMEVDGFAHFQIFG
jgi:hypothetical protein